MQRLLDSVEKYYSAFEDAQIIFATVGIIVFFIILAAVVADISYTCWKSLSFSVRTIVTLWNILVFRVRVKQPAIVDSSGNNGLVAFLIALAAPAANIIYACWKFLAFCSYTIVSWARILVRSATPKRSVVGTVDNGCTKKDGGPRRASNACRGKSPKGGQTSLHKKARRHARSRGNARQQLAVIAEGEVELDNISWNTRFEVYENLQLEEKLQRIRDKIELLRDLQSRT
ncbi:hypothetical protein HGRIS_004000 [Hohenbuehelia grisea]|uniref:Uncharacterized protein n=1 Tax=Hohenbuehelia grisea TaxID=104357 RepID=A0ABR3JH62_9AGAR